MKLRHLLWSLDNWLHGYAFGPVQRCRLCDHTSPGHYPFLPALGHPRRAGPAVGTLL